MSKLSIFDSAWTDMVFEGRNQEYGAYQLRKENPRTTLLSLFLAFALLALAVGLPTLINALGPTAMVSDLPKIPETTIVVTAIVQPKPPKPQLPKTDAAPPAFSAEKPKGSLANAQVTEAPKADAEVPKNTELPTTVTSPTGVVGGTGTTPTATATGTDIGEAPTTAVEGPYVTAVLDKKPAFPGGMEKFYKYIGDNFRVPEETANGSAVIKVIVSFVIEKDGSITDIQVLRNPGYGMDKEAIRVLKAMKTKWTPGVLNGKPVRTAYSLPISVTPKD